MYKSYLIIFTSMLGAKMYVDENGKYHKYSDNCEIDSEEKALDIANQVALNINGYERVNVYEYIYDENTEEDIVNLIF